MEIIGQVLMRNRIGWTQQIKIGFLSDNDEAVIAADIHVNLGDMTPQQRVEFDNSTQLYSRVTLVVGE